MAKNPTVLLVDPDARSRAETQRTLALAGYAIVGESAYGIEALTLAGETEPDLLVIALEEPIVRPLQTIQEIVAAFPRLPIIVYSSLSGTATIRQAMRLGVKDYLARPLKGEELAQAIGDVLKQEQSMHMHADEEIRAITAHGAVVTVFGAKGGIGKTIIATNLAAGLAQQMGPSVALVDLDTRFGDVAVMMDLKAERSLASLALPEDELDRETVRSVLVRHSSGVMVLPAPPRPEEWRSLTPSHVEKVIGSLAEVFDYVILDTPGAFSEVIYSALQVSTVVLLVTTGELASLKDSVLSLELMEGWGFPAEKVKVILNHATGVKTVKRQEIERALRREIFWELPYDRLVGTSTQFGQPVVLAKPKARISRSLSGLANTLSGIGRGHNPKVGWRRLLTAANAGARV